jgi:endonuclease YncB( thermonuclease family)
MGRRFPGGASALLFVAAGALALGLPPRGAWAAQDTAATVLFVHDGDTIGVELAGGVRIRLHLLGVAAPDLRGVRPGGGPAGVAQPFAEEARRALEDLALHRLVRVFLYGRDAFRQVMAEVVLEGENVNVHMVRAGLARVDRAARHVPEALRLRLESAEAEARREKRGLWMFE